MSKEKRKRIKRKGILVYSTNKIVNNFKENSEDRLQVCVTKELSLRQQK